MGHIKTTIDIPDALFRKAKSHAAENGQSLKDFVAETLQSSLAAATTGAASAEPKWMAGFGQLRRLKKGTGRIQGLIDEAFEVVEVEDSR